MYRFGEQGRIVDIRFWRRQGRCIKLSKDLGFAEWKENLKNCSESGTLFGKPQK